MEELLFEGEKEIAKFPSTVSFENTSMQKYGKSKEFYFQWNKDDTVFSCNKQKLQVEIFLGQLLK